MDAEGLSDFIKANWDEIFERIKRITQTKTQVDLAKILGIKQSSVSDAKRRSSIPSEWVVVLALFLNVNPQWLIFGKGQEYISNGSAATVNLDLTRISLEEMGREMLRRFSTEERSMKNDTQDLVSFRHLFLLETDTILDIMHNIMPRLLANKLVDHIFITRLKIESKTATTRKRKLKIPTKMYPANSVRSRFGIKKRPEGR